MASAALRRYPKLCVGRVVRALEVSLVTAIALGRCRSEVIVEVASRARQRCMRPGQRVTRVLQVIELRADEVIHCVAGFAGGGEVKRHVIDHRRQKILLVARVTCRR